MHSTQTSARPIPSLQNTWFSSNTVGEPAMNKDTNPSGFNAALPWRGHFKATALNGYNAAAIREDKPTLGSPP